MHAVETATYWSERYQQGQTGWDLQGETPVFANLRAKLKEQQPDSRRKVLIPGCGFGHDAVAWAKDGFSVTAVDFAPEPIEHLYAERAKHKLEEVLHPYQQDIFLLHSTSNQQFDIVLEYTCYCAILPEQRSEYVTILASVLKPGGMVCGLFFPLGNQPHIAPPFSVDEQEVQELFTSVGFDVKEIYTHPNSHPARKEREKFAIFVKR